jgi:hypothetical protein
MAEITIRFRHNRRTGKKELVIGCESDEELLAHEHERDHRALVEKLIGQKLDDQTEIVIERVEKGAAPTGAAEPEATPRAPEKLKT